MQLHKGLFLNQRVSKQSSIVRALKSSCLEKQTCDEKEQVDIMLSVKVDS